MEEFLKVLAKHGLIGGVIKALEDECLDLSMDIERKKDDYEHIEYLSLDLDNLNEHQLLIAQLRAFEIIQNNKVLKAIDDNQDLKFRHTRFKYMSHERTLRESDEHINDLKKDIEYHREKLVDHYVSKQSVIKEALEEAKDKVVDSGMFN